MQNKQSNFLCLMESLNQCWVNQLTAERRKKACKQCHAAFTFPQASHQCLQLVSSLEKLSLEKSILRNIKLYTRHGTITGFKVYCGLKKSHSFKTTKIFHYTVSAVCAVFLWVKDGKCRTPSVVCREERTSHSAPPPPVGASGQCSCSSVVRALR